MILRRLIKAVGGAEKSAQYGYIVTAFDLETGLWKKEFVNLKGTKLRAGIGDTEEQVYEVVEFGQPRGIGLKVASAYLKEWDKIRKGQRDALATIAVTIQEFQGKEGFKRAEELALQYKLRKLGVSR